MKHAATARKRDEKSRVKSLLLCWEGARSGGKKVSCQPLKRGDAGWAIEGKNYHFEVTASTQEIASFIAMVIRRQTRPPEGVCTCPYALGERGEKVVEAAPGPNWRTENLRAKNPRSLSST